MRLCVYQCRGFDVGEERERERRKRRYTSMRKTSRASARTEVKKKKKKKEEEEEEEERGKGRVALRRERPSVANMHFHSGLILPILFVIASCPLTLRARKVAPLIEDDWARRPHRAAGK
ncbi:dorsal-ventral patterning protein sog-like protein [Lasius niger]|uniref:Dorsal-ventral patterning protein sog-like protein n=1 Tax=Lasius niger TaxID=67767 RepID=A0A0J7KZT3_LASNI|nr:dorsal-ventral patterning protein sog-like protein [Lasius niger]